MGTFANLLRRPARPATPGLRCSSPWQGASALACADRYAGSQLAARNPRCALRTTALLGPVLGRLLRFSKVPKC